MGFKISQLGPIMLATMHYQERPLTKSADLPLRDLIFETVLKHLKEHENEVDGRDIYAEALHQVEAVTLSRTLKHCRYNQSKAAKILGLNRGTLRKKLEYHNLL